MARKNFSGYRGLWGSVAQNCDFDFPSLDSALHDQLVVVGHSLAKPGNEFTGISRFVDADRRSGVGRLDENRIGERLGDGLHRELHALAFEFVPPKAQPRQDGDARMGEQFLGDVLVHLDRRAQDPGSHIGDFLQFEQSLECSVLSTAAMDNRKDHVECDGGVR